LLGPDADLASARSVFERLVPDEATRQLCAAIFASTIEQAHAAGEARWQISLQRDLVRLNGGRVLLFDVKAEDVFAGVDPKEVSAEALAALEKVATRSEGFLLMPHLQLYRLPQHAVAEIWPLIEPGFRKYVAEAVLTGRRCVWSRLHAPAAVDYLGLLVGRGLPQPNYGPAAGDVDAERRIYWVNQGKSFEDELANGYVFAQKKDAGARPSRGRARQPRPGPQSLMAFCTL